MANVISIGFGSVLFDSCQFRVSVMFRSVWFGYIQFESDSDPSFYYFEYRCHLSDTVVGSGRFGSIRFSSNRVYSGSYQIQFTLSSLGLGHSIRINRFELVLPSLIERFRSQHGANCEVQCAYL